jgi:hypothetical protein
MFINWKIIVTVVIVLFVLLAVLGNNPTISAFFSSIKDRITPVIGEKEASRAVQFSLIMNSYGPISFATSRMLNISISGDTTAILQEGRIEINKTINIINYHGSGAIDNILILDGSFEKLERPEISIFLNGPVKLNSSYSLLAVDNLALKSLTLNTSGVLTVSGAETRFSGTISVFEPAGRFVFDRTNGTSLSIVGSAQSITIPSAGINIG